MLKKEITEQYDESVFKEALNIFIDDSKQVIENISAGRDTDKIKKLAHRLKGSCLMIGARTLADLSQSIEKKEGKATAAEIEELKLAHQELCLYLSNHYHLEHKATGHTTHQQ